MFEHDIGAKASYSISQEFLNIICISFRPILQSWTWISFKQQQHDVITISNSYIQGAFINDHMQVCEMKIF